VKMFCGTPDYRRFIASTMPIYDRDHMHWTPDVAPGAVVPIGRYALARNAKRATSGVVSLPPSDEVPL
jgi:hypothetical protein